MSHLNFESDINNVLRMDAPLASGSQMRWQRKLMDNSNVSRNESMMNSSAINSSIHNASTTKTPSKKLSNLSLSTSMCNKTPTSKTPHKNNKTPGK